MQISNVPAGRILAMATAMARMEQARGAARRSPAFWRRYAFHELVEVPITLLRLTARSS